jgi:uncharacterized protein (UPF0333 family)
MNGLRPIAKKKKGQSSLELLITLSFGLIILLPIVILAFVQISNSTSTLSATESQGAATKLADLATLVGSQGYPAKQLVLIQVPPDVQNIYVGNQTNGVGHEIIFLVGTNAGNISDKCERAERLPDQCCSFMRLHEVYLSLYSY